MVRRHRIGEEEVKPVMRAVHRCLSEMVELEPLPEDAYNLYTLLWRFKEHRTGPPHYPDATREAIASLLLETSECSGEVRARVASTQGHERSHMSDV